MDRESTIRVGIAERHGMFDEVAHDPPAGIEFCFPDACPPSFRLIRSSVMGYMRGFDDDSCDVFEAVFSPIVTRKPWILSTDSFHAAITFTLMGAPLPRSLRLRYVESILKKDNFKRLTLWSEAAFRELEGILGDSYPSIMEKATVVYPAIRSVPNAERQDAVGDRVNLLFSGDFFRKGGANVVDAFERLQSKYSGVRLRVCCDERIDFDTADQQLRDNYLTHIRSNEGIEFGRVPRDEMLGRILHETDIYLLPTYAESFGFALLEAMAYGLPVIATNEFAIPEIVDHGKTGFLIDISEFNVLSFVRGYQVQTIPEDFRQYISGQLFDYLVQLIESPELRRDMGERGKSVALSKFAIETRNQQMLDIYRSSIG